MTSQKLIKAFHQTETHFFSQVSQKQLKLTSLDAYYTGVCSYGGFARIDDVATFPSEQKKGFAADLTRYALQLAKDKGITHCFLEASTDGLGLYQKLGFQELFKNDYLLHHD